MLIIDNMSWYILREILTNELKKMYTSRYLRFHAIDFQKRFAHFFKTLKIELLGFAMQQENNLADNYLLKVRKIILK